MGRMYPDIILVALDGEQGESASNILILGGYWTALSLG